MAKSNYGQVPLSCDMCELPSDVPWYCSNCEASLCSKCKADHLEGKPCSIFKKHNIIFRVDALKKKSQEEHCPKHHPNMFVLHCNNCKELVCTTCIHKDHAGHTMGEIADAMKIAEQEITKFSKILESVTLANCSSVDSKATKIIENCHQWYVSLETEVNKRREEVKTAVDCCCNKILVEAAEVKAIHQSATEEKKNQVQTCSTDIKSMFRKCEEALGKSNSQKLQFSKEISASAEYVVPTVVQVQLPKFIPGETVNQQISQQIGQLKTSQIDTDFVNPLEQIFVNKKQGRGLSYRESFIGKQDQSYGDNVSYSHKRERSYGDKVSHSGKQDRSYGDKVLHSSKQDRSYGDKVSHRINQERSYGDSLHSSKQDQSYGDKVSHSSKQDQSYGDKVLHSSKQDQSYGDKVSHSSKQDQSYGDKNPFSSKQYQRL